MCMWLSILVIYLHIVVVSFSYLLGCAIFSFSTNSTPMQIGRSKHSTFSRYSDICLWLFLQQIKENFIHLKMILGNILTKTKQKKTKQQKKNNKHSATSNSFQHVSNVNTIGREFILQNCFAPQFRRYT